MPFRLRWASVQYNWCPYKKRTETRREEPVRTQGADAHPERGGEKASEETKPISTLVSHFQPPELRENKFLLFKLPSGAYLVMSAPAEECRWWADSPWLPLAAPRVIWCVPRSLSENASSTVTLDARGCFPFHVSCVFPNVSSCAFQDLEPMPVLLLQRPPLAPGLHCLSCLGRNNRGHFFWVRTLRSRDRSERSRALGPGLQVLLQ